jgi:hypothetical protein
MYVHKIVTSAPQPLKPQIPAPSISSCLLLQYDTVDCTEMKERKKERKKKAKIVGETKYV